MKAAPVRLYFSLFLSDTYRFTHARVFWVAV